MHALHTSLLLHIPRSLRNIGTCYSYLDILIFSVYIYTETIHLNLHKCILRFRNRFYVRTNVETIKLTVTGNY